MILEKNPCENCSICCEYVSLDIDTPKTKKEFDEIKWYLLHKNVWIYIDNDDSWNLQFNAKCKKLNNKRCGDYEKRPIICREHSEHECEKHGTGEAFKILFKNLKEFEDWIKKGKVIPN